MAHASAAILLQQSLQAWCCVVFVHVKYIGGGAGSAKQIAHLVSTRDLFVSCATASSASDGFARSDGRACSGPLESMSGIAVGGSSTALLAAAVWPPSLVDVRLFSCAIGQWVMQCSVLLQRLHMRGMSRIPPVCRRKGMNSRWLEASGEQR